MPEMRVIELHLVLDATTPGAWGGVQFGSGSAATVTKWQQMTGGEARFVAPVHVRDGVLPLRGETIQKDGKGRFLYIVWRGEDGGVARRAKVYVETIDQSMVDSGRPLAILLPGRAKDGLPCCATVKPLRDWMPLP